jgi:hypothetical protein
VTVRNNPQTHKRVDLVPVISVQCAEVAWSRPGRFPQPRPQLQEVNLSAADLATEGAGWAEMQRLRNNDCGRLERRGHPVSLMPSNQITPHLEAGTRLQREFCNWMEGWPNDEKGRKVCPGSRAG